MRIFSRLLPFLLLAFPILPAAGQTQELPLTGTVERYMAIDNVCAWPNLTVMPDGSITAAIHNRPISPGFRHGEEEGSIEVWGSPDGRFWEKRGIAAPHDPRTNRLHAAAGLAKNGDLIVLSSGFSDNPKANQPPQPRFRSELLPIWVCRSSDGGRTWTRLKEFPAAEEGYNRYAPFGDITIGKDGALHVSCYASKPGPGRKMTSWHFRSDDDGRTWRRVSVIGPDSNETALFRLGDRRWLAAARSDAVYLYRSDDDGLTWQGPQRVSEQHQLPGHLLRLADGRLVLSYGTRIDDQFGVLATFSRDEGRTWSAPVRLADSLAYDCGYPSSIQRPDGSIVTAYYAGSIPNHSRYSMSVVIWTPPAP